MRKRNIIQKRLEEKLKEASFSVLPIMLLVLLLCLLVVPVSSGILLTFLVGGLLLIIGMMFFTIGAEFSISLMGEYAGAYMTKTRKLHIVILLSLFLGFVITISEPDLQVLAGLVPTIPNTVLILAVSAGVGVFLVIALLRMLFGIALPPLLLFFYAVVFVLTYFVPESFLTVAFDSGGVTTGPMTVPFIMALGIGIAASRSDRHAADDSFGLVAICSIGPIIAVLLLGMIYHPSDTAYTASQIPDVADSQELLLLFCSGLPAYIREIAVSMLPILLLFAAFQFTILHLPRLQLYRLMIGLVYTYIGLVLFLTGAQIGFMPAGSYLGQMLVTLDYHYALIPIGMLMGFFIVRAEPAVYVMTKQVADLTDGGISAHSIGTALSIGMAVSVGIGMTRVLTGISILYFLIPGYLLSLVIAFFVPKIYTAIAFDSGGVVSGPMTAAFLVPFAQGACLALGGDIVTDAFGIVAMVAMTPLLTIQIMGLISEIRKRTHAAKHAAILKEYEDLHEDAIINL